MNEYRACWKLAGQPLAQRLRDKSHNRKDLGQLVPDALALGLMGYAYICPDMIGGGEYSYFYNDPDKALDQELIVRHMEYTFRHQGPTRKDIQVPLKRLPWFRLSD